MTVLQQHLDTDLGANHHMTSDVSLRDDGHVDGKTRTRTGTWFGGFTGGVQLLFYDANDTAIGMSQEHSFGVDGSVIGRNDRTDYWGEDMDPALRARVSRFDILQFWAPKYSAIDNIVQHAVNVAEKAGPLIKELKDAGLIK